MANWRVKVTYRVGRKQGKAIVLVTDQPNAAAASAVARDVVDQDTPWEDWISTVATKIAGKRKYKTVKPAYIPLTAVELAKLLHEELGKDGWKCVFVETFKHAMTTEDPANAIDGRNKEALQRVLVTIVDKLKKKYTLG